LSLKIDQGELRVRRPAFDTSSGDRLKAVVRPESINIVDAQTSTSADRNVLKGRIEVAMYIGSIMRYTITTGDQTVYVDESDPQYQGIFQEGSAVKLVLKKRIHLLKEA
jgi:ABC-type Fe3+/spermidine/putrescine transport system ATPase subunit